MEEGRREERGWRFLCQQGEHFTEHKFYLAVECSNDIVSNSVSICIEQTIDIINHLSTMVSDCKSGS